MAAGEFYSLLFKIVWGLFPLASIFQICSVYSISPIYIFIFFADSSYMWGEGSEDLQGEESYFSSYSPF